MTRVLVLGGSGMLGHMLCRQLPRRGFAVSATLRRDAAFADAHPEVFGECQIAANLDVLDAGAVEDVFREFAPEFVVNCVGLVKQHARADDAYLNVGLNALLPHRLARLCEEQGRRLIHVSTDCVFDGSRGGYREDDESDAQDLYGKAKFLGETGPDEACAVTLRTSIIGPELTQPTHGLLEWFLSQDGKACRGFDRAVFSGLTTLELTNVIERVMRHKSILNGMFQVAAAPITKFDLLNLIRTQYDLDVRIERDAEFVCNRSLIMERFALETGYAAPTWEAMLDAMHADAAFAPLRN